MMTKRPEFPPFPEWPQPAITGLVEPGDEPIDFTPVPRQRSRRNGWTEATQRAFIAALEECASVSRSARAVGMSPRSAYRLLGAEGADSFAEAWDIAIARGVERVRGDAMLRAIHGSWVPVVRRGRVVRMEYRTNDRFALGILSGRNANLSDTREQAVSRRKYRLQLQLLEQQRAEERRREEELRAAHQAIIDNPPRPMARPRFRIL
jgi:hypothetical protein